MPLAELYGKISSDIGLEDKEDLLTSDMFGSVRYLDPNFLLKQILEGAQNSSGKVLNITSQIKEVHYYFWPNWFEHSQPDIFIELFTESNRISIFIEVKLWSGLSSDDQLEREWDDLQTTKADDYYLIYLNSHRYFPKLEFEVTSKLLNQENMNNIYWTNWYQIRDLLETLSKKEISEYSQNIYLDMIDILKNKGFERFEGWKDITCNKIPIFYGKRFDNYWSKLNFNRVNVFYKRVEEGGLWINL